MNTKLLEETLSSQVDLFEELHAVLERETAELAEMNLAAMAESQRHKEELSARIESHSTTIRQQISALAAERGLPSDGSLGTLAAAVGTKTDLPRLRNKLGQAVQRVQELAAVNCAISERFAKTADMALGILTSALKRSNVYGVTGGYVSGTPVSVMLNQEA